jgi:hypothetical protein
MGTALSLGFIVAAAATGIFVGTRPTVMDGRWIAAKLTKAAAAAAESSGGAGGGEGTGVGVRAALECDREIRVGAAGAEFACTVRSGARLRYRMSRDGKVDQIGVEPVRRGRAGEADPAEGGADPAVDPAADPVGEQGRD